MSIQNNNTEILSEKRKKLESDQEVEDHINKKPNMENTPENEPNTTQMETPNQLEYSETTKPVLFNGQDIDSLSKSQMKKYKKMLSWEASKKEKRKKEKQRVKQRKIEARLNNVDLGPSRKQLKMSKMSDSTCKTSVIIDLSFDELMIPKVFDKQNNKYLKYTN